MKFVVNQLKIGDLVKAEVVELISATSIIANFNGDLIRVENQSKKQFKVGDKIQLRVSAILPLAFQLVGPSFPSKIDISV